jgi:hypothetical protein
MAETPLREFMPLKTVKSPVSQSGARSLFKEFLEFEVWKFVSWFAAGQSASVNNCGKGLTYLP